MARPVHPAYAVPALVPTPVPRAVGMGCDNFSGMPTTNPTDIPTSRRASLPFVADFTSHEPVRDCLPLTPLWPLSTLRAASLARLLTRLQPRGCARWCARRSFGAPSPSRLRSAGPVTTPVPRAVGMGCDNVSGMPSTNPTDIPTSRRASLPFVADSTSHEPVRDCLPLTPLWPLSTLRAASLARLLTRLQLRCCTPASNILSRRVTEQLNQPQRLLPTHRKKEH